MYLVLPVALSGWKGISGCELGKLWLRYTHLVYKNLLNSLSISCEATIIIPVVEAFGIWTYGKEENVSCLICSLYEGS